MLSALKAFSMWSLGDVVAHVPQYGEITPDRRLVDDEGRRRDSGKIKLGERPRIAGSGFHIHKLRSS
jgi:hypothetical protein